MCNILYFDFSWRTTNRLYIYLFEYNYWIKYHTFSSFSGPEIRLTYLHSLCEFIYRNLHRVFAKIWSVFFFPFICAVVLARNVSCATHLCLPLTVSCGHITHTCVRAQVITTVYIRSITFVISETQTGHWCLHACWTVLRLCYVA